MAEGYEAELSHSTLMGSEDGDLRPSIQMGSQESYEYYCQPCDVDHNHVEAIFYCNNCQEYMCKTCGMYHKRFQQLKDHNMLDVRHMTYKPPISQKRSASTRAVTMATHVKDIKTKGRISSSALMSTNHLLVADHDNNKVRLVDTGSGKQVSELVLSSWPGQVTTISDTEAAVTIPDDRKVVLLTIQQKTVLLMTKQKLSVVREISVQGRCHGIAYMDNRLFVTFSDGHVGILDMSGEVLSKITTNQTVKDIFFGPLFITVDPVTGSMFMSVWGEKSGRGDKVVKLSKEGNVLATYIGACPNQVTLDTQGMIYVAGKSGSYGCVEQLSAECAKVRTIVPDLEYTKALSYDEATQQLYVGQMDGNVKVYKLS